MYILALFFNMLLAIQLLSFAVLLILVAWRERHGHPYGWSSSLVTACLLVLSTAAILAFELVPHPYIGFMSWWSVAWLVVSMLYASSVKAREWITRGREPPGQETRSPLDSCRDGLETKHEKARKAFHLAGFLALLAYLVVGPLLAPVVHEAILGAGGGYTDLFGPFEEVVIFTSEDEAGRFLTLFALVATLILVTLLDVTRLLAGEQYSLIHLIEKRAGRILREKEKGSPGPQVYIAASSTAAWVLGMLFLPVVPGAMMLALAAIMISTLADGIAAIVGKAWGKHKIARPFDQVKSIEGFIAGTVSAFIIALCFTTWILALVAAITFFIVDYISPPVADNAINPVLLCGVLCGLALILP